MENICIVWHFPGGALGTESTCQCRRHKRQGYTGDTGSLSGSGRSPGVGNGTLLQCSCLENSMDRGAWQATVHGPQIIRCDWAHAYSIRSFYIILWGTSLVAQMVKNLPAIQETWVWSLCWEDLLEKGMTTHSSILVWEISMDRGAWQATVHVVAELDMTEQLAQSKVGYHFM